MFDGTFYLTGIDDKYKRFYAYKGLSNIPESSASIKSAKTSQVDFSGVPTSSAVRLNAMKMQLLASSSSNEKEAKSGENNNSKKQQQQQ